jgi:hypothetical protein
LATRKPVLDVGGTSVPGFFSDTGESADTAWFFVGVLGEVLGLIALNLGGALNGGMYLPLGAFTALAFVWCDYLFAVRLHRREGLRCKVRTLIYLEGDVAKRVALQHELSRGKSVDFLLRLGIFLVAVLKIAAILLLGVFTAIVLYVPFLVIYLIVAHIHTSHTGYWWAYRRTDRQFKKDHDNIIQHPAQAMQVSVCLAEPLRGVPLRNGSHEIAAATPTTGAGQNEYTIAARGVLTDDDILNLILQHAQTRGNEAALFKACRRLQFQSLSPY